MATHHITENFFFLFLLFTRPKVELTPSGIYNPNGRGSDVCRGDRNCGQEHKCVPN